MKRTRHTPEQVISTLHEAATCRRSARGFAPSLRVGKPRKHVRHGNHPTLVTLDESIGAGQRVIAEPDLWCRIATLGIQANMIRLVKLRTAATTPLHRRPIKNFHSNVSGSRVRRAHSSMPIRARSQELSISYPRRIRLFEMDPWMAIWCLIR